MIQDAGHRLAQRLGVPESVVRLADRVHALQLARSVLWAVIIYGAILGVVYLLERRSGEDPGRYRTRHFANDVAYTLFFKGGFYDILVLAAITNAFDSQLSMFRLHLLAGVPWWAGFAAFWILGDFLTYWWHRLQHGSRFLWAFHSVHHSQEHLTMLTASRRHPLEKISMDVLIYFVVFNLLLGIPTQGWLPFTVVATALTSLQHTQLDWRLGPFARVVVSPRFHSFHHSVEARHANANFGFLFSCWDCIFGTAILDEARPLRYGVEGRPVQETLWDQLVSPFRQLRRTSAVDPVPVTPAPRVLQESTDQKK